MTLSDSKNLSAHTMIVRFLLIFSPCLLISLFLSIRPTQAVFNGMINDEKTQDESAKLESMARYLDYLVGEVKAALGDMQGTEDVEWKKSMQEQLKYLEQIKAKLKNAKSPDEFEKELSNAEFEKFWKKTEELNVRYLKNLIRDPAREESIRATAIGKLVEDKNQTAIPLFFELAKNDSNARIRIRAAEALYQLGDRNAYETILGLFQHPDTQIRSLAVNMLVKYDEKRAAPHVIEAFTRLDRRKEEWNSFADALGRLGDSRAVEPLIRALDNEPYNFFIIRALGRLRDKRAVKSLKGVFERKKAAISSEEQIAKIVTAWALYQSGEKDYVDYLIERVNVAAAAPAKSVVIAEPYRQIAENPEYQRQVAEGKVMEFDWWAIRYLGLTGDPGAVEPLIRCLQSKDLGNVVLEAAKVLGRLGDKRAIKPLVEAAQRVDNGSVYNPVMILARAIVLFDDPHAQSAFDGLVPNKEQREEIRRAAKKAGYLGVFPAEE